MRGTTRMATRFAAKASRRPQLVLVTRSSAAVVPADVPDDDWEDRRSFPRHSMSELSWLDDVRLKYGPAVTLIDLSAGGAQIETSGHPLQPGATVVVEITANDETFVVPSRVLRAQVSSLAGCPTYRGALAFKRTFELPTARGGHPGGRDISLAHEHARLNVALRRLIESAEAKATITSDIAQAAVSAALAVADSVSAMHDRTPLAREIGRVFQLVADALDEHTDAAEILRLVADRLRRVVPTRSVRLTRPGAVDGIPKADAIYFDVPSTPRAPATRLLVEFTNGCRLERWHLKFLQAAVHVVGLVQALESARVATDCAEERASVEAETDDLPPGWQRVVVRYIDGRLLKGYNRDFVPSSGHIHVWQAPEGARETRISVPLGQLKAIFFVHDLEGAPAQTDTMAATAPERGRRIDITFLDDEHLSGRTLNYSPETSGFFVFPIDPTTNNSRVFAMSAAVRHVQFP